LLFTFLFFFSSRRRHTRSYGDWSSDVCSSDLHETLQAEAVPLRGFFETPTIAGLAALTVACEARPGQTEKIAKFLQQLDAMSPRSEERRVGKECRTRWWTSREKKKTMQRAETR